MQLNENNQTAQGDDSEDHVLDGNSIAVYVRMPMLNYSHSQMLRLLLFARQTIILNLARIRHVLLIPLNVDCQLEVINNNFLLDERGTDVGWMDK